MMEENFVETPRRGRLEQMLGTVIDSKYRIDAFLGRGGMGTVWKAEQLHIHRAVAIKLLRGGDFGEISDEALERFKREAAVASKLRHDNTVILFDSGVHEGSPYLVMEYLVGETLRARLRSVGKLPVEAAAIVCAQIAAGLTEAHSHGVLHRDLKPENVMLVTSKNGTERAVVLDFGVAKLLGGPDSSLTEQGVLIGTPHYISPEQIRGQEVTFSSDVYALGIMLYEMLTGAVPFKGDSALSVAMQHLNDAPEPVERILPESPFATAIDRLLERALAKKPSDRFQTPLDLSQAFTAIFESNPTRPELHPAAPIGAVPDRRLVLLSLLFLVLAIYHFLGSSRSPTKPPVPITPLGPTEPPAVDSRREQLKEARQLASEGRNIDALQRYQQLLAVNPTDSTLLGELGAVLISLNQLREAGEAFAKALELNPEVKGVRANYGYVLLLQQRFGEAATELRKVIAASPRDSTSRNNLGNALLGEGKLDAAIEQFRAGLDIDPKNSYAAFNLGEALVRKNDIRGAAEAYTAGISADPENKAAIAREREIRAAL